MRRSARVTTDRVSVRRGPYEGHRRLALVDSGTAVVATARAGDWVQVTLAGGQNGWIRQDFVSIGKSAAEPERRTARGERPKQNRVSATRRSSTRTASATPARKPATAAKAKAARSERKAEPSRTARSSKSQTASKARTASKAQTASKARTASKAETASKQARAAEAARRTAAANRAKSRAAAAARQRERARVASASGSGEVVRSAYAYRGTPYRYGGTGRSGFDCSGFTRHIYAKKGVNLPHSARGQASRGRRVSRSELKEGDLVFFHTTRRGISHVGIYAGNGKFVHASSGGGSVRVDTLDSGYYKERFRGGRRVR